MNLQDKTVVVELKPGVVFAPERFRSAIRKAGYTVRGFQLTVLARVEQTRAGYRLRLPKTDQWLAVRTGGAAALLGTHVGRLVRVVGLLAADGPPLELEIAAVETIEE